MQITGTIFFKCFHKIAIYFKAFMCTSIQLILLRSLYLTHPLKKTSGNFDLILVKLLNLLELQLNIGTVKWY